MDTHTDDAAGRVNTGPYANRVVIGFACRKDNVIGFACRKDNVPLCSEWNLFNQLCECDTSVSVGSLEVALKYGDFGRRVARSHSSGNVVYVHAGQQVIADDARGAAITSSSTYRYVYADYVDEPILRHTGTTTTLPTTGDNALCYHRNQQYSIVGLTNAAGTLVERYTYSAYGTLGIYAANGTVRSSSTYANRYTYTGREWDAELRLYHFRARWYDPATGGFVSRDPLGYVDAMSLYRGYFGVRFTDAYGLWIVNRDSNLPVAQAIPDQNGNTIRELAELIGIAPEEYLNWLDMNYSSEGIPTLDDPVCECSDCIYLVPNTIFVNYAGDAFQIGQLVVDWWLNVDYLRLIGFHVHDTASITPPIDSADHNSRLRRLSSDKKLHGLFVWGHGDRDGYHYDFHQKNPRYRYSDIRNNLSYRLGLVIINACHSDNAASRSLFSERPNGRFQGFHGVLFPTTVPFIDSLVYELYTGVSVSHYKTTWQIIVPPLQATRRHSYISNDQWYSK